MTKSEMIGMEGLYTVDLRNHCLFCLQLYSKDEVSSSVGKNIRSFELLRKYLIESGGKSEGVQCEPNQEKKAPPTCNACFLHFDELQRTHEQLVSLQEQLRNQIRTIREVVGGALPTYLGSSRWNDFVESLSSGGLSGIQVQMTCNLVKNLHRLIINEKGAELKSKDASPPTTNEFIKAEADELNDPEMETNEWEDPQLSPFLPEDGAGDNQATGLLKLDDSLDFTVDDSTLNIKEEFVGEVVDPKCNSKLKRKRRHKHHKPFTRVKIRGQKILKDDSEKLVIIKQACDLCGERVPVDDILQHVQGHVKEFATKCANPSCKYVFSCKLKMLRHLQVSQTCKKVTPHSTTREASWVRACELCNFSGNKTYSLRTHLRAHEMEVEGTVPKTECPIPGCIEKFYLKQSMEYHLFRHNLKTTNKQKCTLCKKSPEFALQEMEGHLRSIHNVTEIFKCNHCSFLFDNVNEKIKHVYEHREESGVSCDICDDEAIKFTRLPPLQLHYFNVHQLGTLSAVVCQYCGREYASKAGLHSHQRTSHQDIIGKLVIAKAKELRKCDLCPQEYSSYDAMVGHKIRVHGAPRLPCRICGETFQSIKLQKTHMKSHAGTNLDFKCKVPGCEKDCKNSARLKRHEEVHHWVGKEKPYVCQTCGKGFGLQKSLKNHIDTVHLGITPIRCVCDECGKSFAGPMILKEHKRIHSGERPYVCKICGQAFKQHGTMLTHVKAHEKRGQKFKGRGQCKQTAKAD